jgi:glyoxylase-like metal-dependent hydrolase (beta-lactamase superfamily II)
VHADHITGAQELRKVFPGVKLGIGAGVKKVQETFKPIFNLEFLKTDGSQWDKLFQDGEHLHVGDIDVEAIFTPGHTPDSASYYVGDCGICVGDTLFYPDKVCLQKKE